MANKGFKLWDSIALADNIKLALQIKNKIEKLSHEGQVEVQDMPDSIVPTEALYEMMACFVAAYDMLLDQELVRTGNLKSSSKRNNLH